jgi:ferredoxin
MAATKGTQQTKGTKGTRGTLMVNPINCTGHGVCAELLPELISVDEWGYPIVDPRPVPPQLDREARRAVAACPALALKLAALPEA